MIARACVPGSHYADQANDVDAVSRLLALHDEAVRASSTLVTGLDAGSRPRGGRGDGRGRHVRSGLRSTDLAVTAPGAVPGGLALDEAAGVLVYGDKEGFVLPHGCH
ncbi:hypothetical protein [Streptomyces sp. NPDC051636]|uniref:hypothetical protein n=1 Tax=Streptomyces sp. NPDC051636 TaxID=3365663 RepID=UPI0037A2285F